MNSLRSIQVNFMDCAKGLGEYQNISKADLFNGYCDAEEAHNELKRSQYWAALLLRYWYKIFDWERECKSLNLPITDYVDWLDDCLRDAMYYRSWRATRQITKDANGCFIGDYVANPQYQANDPNAADKSMNYFCGAKRAKMYQAYNKSIRRANVGTVSLDSSVDENGDCALKYAGAYVNDNAINGIYYLIKKYIDDGKSIEALILDGIAYQDAFKETKITTAIPGKDFKGKDIVVKQHNYATSFQPNKLVKHLCSIDESFMQKYFCKEYRISKEKSSLILNDLSKVKRPQLYKYVKLTLLRLQKSKELLGYIN